MASAEGKQSKWHWNCSSKYCKNSWRTPEISYYRLTKVQGASKEIIDVYLDILGKTKDKVKWTKAVLCSVHWSKQPENIVDVTPDVKFATRKLESETNWHWNCAAALCNNSWRTAAVPNSSLQYYKLSEVQMDKCLKIAYDKILKNKKVNWGKGVICSEHWSKGFRANTEDLPDRSTTASYVQSQPSYIKPPKNIASAKRCLKNEGKEPKQPRRKIERVMIDSIDPKDEIIKTISDENCELKKELLLLREKLKEKDQEMIKMANELDALRIDKEQYQNQLKRFQFEFEKSRFTYEHIKKRGQCFYMTGMTDMEFDCLYECVEPYVSCLVYPDMKSSDFGNRKMDTRTELMAFMTILRHSLHLGIMGWMTNTSISTQSRVFVAWSVFLVVLFDSIDLSPLPGESEAFIPTEFVNAGFGDTSCLGDCTETKIMASENFDVNNTTFSQYKNHTTGKTAVWITPQGSLLQCSDTYPGSISDSDITEQSGVLDMVKKGSIVLTDKGFGITDLCLKKGLHHNRPPLKFDIQYEETDISKNFDIATLRIYNENYIGRMRDWAIMNACWPLNRIDILCYVHRLLAHIVNIFKKPIGPKDSGEEQDCSAAMFS